MGKHFAVIDYSRPRHVTKIPFEFIVPEPRSRPHFVITGLETYDAKGNRIQAAKTEKGDAKKEDHQKAG